MRKVVVGGEIPVEIMAETVGGGFLAPIPLTGPFPSGAPAICIDQVARFGQPCGIAACVGDDDFGRLKVNRLAEDGADVSAIGIHSDRPTGSALVRYCADGTGFGHAVKIAEIGPTGAGDGFGAACATFRLRGLDTLQALTLAAAAGALAGVKRGPVQRATVLPAIQGLAASQRRPV